MKLTALRKPPAEEVHVAVPPITVQCSMPPTANHMHTVARGRKIKSAEYRAWLAVASTEIRASRLRIPQFIVPVQIDMSIPRRHVLSDLDNRIKPLLDAIQNSGLIFNDNLVHKITACWRPKSYQDQTNVWITVSEL